MNRTGILSSLTTLGAVFVLSGSLVRAQVYTPPVQSNNAPPASQGGQNTTIVNQGGQNQGGQQMLGNDVPFFDPTTETFTFDGKTFNVNDNRVFRSRFEKYLNAPEADSETDRAYRATIRDILDTLSPHNRDRAKFPKAVAKL